MGSGKSKVRFFKFIPELIGYKSYLPEADDDVMTTYDVLVYASILAHSSDTRHVCFATYGKLAAELGISWHTVYRAINKLSRMGIVYSVEDLDGKLVHYKCVLPDALLDNTAQLYTQEKRVRQRCWAERHPNQTKGANRKPRKDTNVIRYRAKKR